MQKQIEEWWAYGFMLIMLGKAFKLMEHYFYSCICHPDRNGWEHAVDQLDDPLKYMYCPRQKVKVDKFRSNQHEVDYMCQRLR